MNHQFMHRKQMARSKPSASAANTRDWAQVEYSFSRTRAKASLGEKVIVDLVRKTRRGEEGFLRPHAHSHRLPTQS